VKGTPPAVGIKLGGAISQTGGAFPAQLKLTTLAYPFTEVIVPLNVADAFTEALRGELLIANE
jgi:hypothetical protein